MRRAAPWVVACASALLVTGCGSTVAPTGSGTALSGPAAPGQAPGGDGLGSDGLGGVAGAPTGPGTTTATTGGGTAAAPGQAGAPGVQQQPGTVSGGGAAAPAAAAPRKGAPVQIGFYVAKDVGPATAALGVKGLSTGNGRRHAETTAKLLNRRGGIGGSKVVPVIFEYDVAQDAEQQQQAACSLFFEDNKAIAVVSIFAVPTLMTCAEQNRAPYVSNGDRSTDERTLDRYPHAALPATLSLRRVVATLVPSLQQQGYFQQLSAAEPVKIGLLYNEDPEFAKVPDDVKAQLGRVGLTLTDAQPMPTSDDTSKVTRASNAGSSAVLRFRSKGITHVLSVSKSGQALAYFGLAAQNQDYYPRYGLTSLELPAALRTLLSQRQLEGARGVGWLPVYDVPLTAQPAATKDRTDCLSAMTDAGEDISTATTRGYAFTTCGGGLTLAAAWSRGPLTPAGFVAGLRALGSSFTSVSTFADDFGSRRDGVAAARPMAFSRDCDCFTYTGPTAATAR